VSSGAKSIIRDMRARRIAGCAAAAALFLCILPAFAGEERQVRPVKPELLTKESFRQFGQVIEADEKVKPDYESAVVRYWSGIAKARIHEQTEFGLIKVKAREHEVAEMERNSRSPKLVVSMKGDYYLVVAKSVAKVTRPEAARVRVFLARENQAVVINKGVWNTIPFVKGREGLFLVAYREGTAKRDGKERQLKNGEIIEF